MVAAAVLLALRPGLSAWRAHRRTLPRMAFLQNVAPIALVAAAVEHLDTGIVAILLATTPLLSAAIARVTGAAERLTPKQLVGLVVWAFVLSIPMLLPLALAEWSVRVPDSRALASLIVLGAACTGLATVMYFWLIASAGAARALLVTYLSPAVALAFAAVLLDERMPLLAAPGLPLILAGVAIASRN